MQGGSETCVKYSSEQFISYWQAANWAVIACIFSVTFLVDDLDSDLAPTFWREVLQSCDFIEDRPDFSFVVSLQFLSSAALTPLLSFAFPFLRRSMASWIQFLKIFEWDCVGQKLFLLLQCASSFFFVTFLTSVQNFIKFRKDICDSRKNISEKKLSKKKNYF